MENPAQLRTGSKWRHVLFLFLSCVLLTVVFMAVPRVPNQGAAFFAKQVYYNHGANRGPHLGLHPHVTNSDSQIKSRRLLTKVSFEDHVTSELDTIQAGVASLQ